MKPLYKIAFTGHRPEKLPTGDGRIALQAEIANGLKRALAKYGESHQVVAITGGAQGIDTDAAREAYKLKIPYIVAIPFEGQSSKWETEAQERYQKMCRLANSEIAQLLAKNGERVREGAVYISEGGYEYAKYGKRDRWMVDHCDALIAVYDGSPSGTGKTYDYAKSIGKPVLRIDPKACNAADITSFKGTFLSNMTACQVVYQGITYPSVENFYQAMKTTDHSLRLEISKMNAYESKRFAKTMDIRSDWDDVKDKVMAYGLKQKFAPGSHLANKLLATGNANLVEGNNWNDVYWGVCRGKGLNKLGNMLMKIRASLASQQS